MNIRELASRAAGNYFLWVDTDGQQGTDCGALYQYSTDGDIGDEADVRDTLIRDYQDGVLSLEDLKEYAS